MLVQRSNGGAVLVRSTGQTDVEVGIAQSERKTKLDAEESIHHVVRVQDAFAQLAGLGPAEDLLISPGTPMQSSFQAQSYS